MSDAVLDFLASRGVVPDEESLAHYGVPGMKWGRRKNRSSSSSPAAPGKAAPPKHNNSIAAKPNNRRISDAELRAKVNRLQMEKQLKDLTAPTPRAKNFASELLKESGKQVARTIVLRAAGVAVEMALGKAAGKATNAGNKAFLDAMVKAGQKKGGK